MPNVGKPPIHNRSSNSKQTQVYQVSMKMNRLQFAAYLHMLGTWSGQNPFGLWGRGRNSCGQPYLRASGPMVLSLSSSLRAMSFSDARVPSGLWDSNWTVRIPDCQIMIDHHTSSTCVVPWAPLDSGAKHGNKSCRVPPQVPRQSLCRRPRGVSVTDCQILDQRWSTPRKLRALANMMSTSPTRDAGKHDSNNSSAYRIYKIVYSCIRDISLQVLKCSRLFKVTVCCHNVLMVFKKQTYHRRAPNQCEWSARLDPSKGSRPSDNMVPVPPWFAWLCCWPRLFCKHRSW